jgi:hypothetical protein
VEGKFMVCARKCLGAMFVCLAVAWAACLGAQDRGEARAASQPPPAPPGAYVEPLGVPLAPPIYLVNFLLLYFSNPESATYMPGYRAALPPEVYACLLKHPDGYGCSYSEMAP